MRAIEISAPGGPEVLLPTERSAPRPGEGEILVRVGAAGVNRPDILQRQGKYPPPPGASDIPGLEIAGRIEAIGARVERLAPGDLVCALVSGGGYAELCVVPAPQALHVPAGLDLITAAAIPETTFTVWSNLFERGGLTPGEWVLVHGGSGGIGTTAIQLGRERGARVLATARGEKRSACERLGAVRAVDPEVEDLPNTVREFTEGRGVDVVLDILGGPRLQANLDLLAPDGRLVVIGLLSGVRGEIDMGLVLRRRLTITGSTLRPRSIEEKGAIAAALRVEVWPLLESGRFRPRIDRTFPLAEAADAHRLIERREHVGKIVLVVDDELARTVA